MSASSGLDHTQLGRAGPTQPGLAWPGLAMAGLPSITTPRSARRGDGARFGDVEAAEAPDSGAVW